MLTYWYSPAILYYDFILTLPLEVERYWKSRFTWVSVLFFLNRYGSVLSHIPIIYEHFGDVSKSVRPYSLEASSTAC